MIRIRKAADEKDIAGILSLQKQYLKTPDNQGKDWTDGFVTLRHSEEILKQMIEESPQMIAEESGRIVGYSLSMIPFRSVSFPILKPMLQAFEVIEIEGRKLVDYTYLIGGQCCIDAGYRGKGLLKQLYEGTKKEYPADFCVTEIARTNPRSLQAHLKIGFERMIEYSAEDYLWDIVLWDWRE